MKTDAGTERQHLTGEVLVGPAFLAELGEKLKNAESILDILSEAFEKGTSEVVRVLLGAALIMRASDIHVEPTEEHTQIRFRMDGLLHDMAIISSAQYQGLLSRVKLLSALKLNITDRAQDGRFTVA